MSTNSKKSSFKNIMLEGFPSGLEDALQFPLMDSIMGRRSRRFPFGAEIPDGPLKFQSKHDPLPLSDLEQMIMLSSVSGNTGWFNLIPFNKEYLPHIPNYSIRPGGRTFPSGAGFHTTEIFYTDDFFDLPDI